MMRGHLMDVAGIAEFIALGFVVVALFYAGIYAACMIVKSLFGKAAIQDSDND